MAERREALGLVVEASLRGARAMASWPAELRLAMGATPAPALVLVPQDLRTTDPVRADEIIAGVHVFAGHIVAAENPFAAEPPSAEWAEALASFSWLRHLRAAGTPAAAETGRRRITDWIESQAGGRRQANTPVLMAERLRAWFAASGLLLAGADQVFYRRFSRALWRQVRQLELAQSQLPPGPDRLSVFITLVTAGLCLDGESRLLARASRRLAEELDRQILADGCHVSRDPGVLVSLVLDLLPLRQLFPARNATPPSAVFTAVDRMMPMIRFFQMGDGALARFNGMGPTAIDQVATTLAYDETRGTVPSSAPHGGYERLEAGGSVLMIDVGRPPSARDSAGAHGGCLSFEFSAGRELIVINCGVPAIHRATWRSEARKTAAHSTVGVASRSSITTGKGRYTRGLVLSGPRRVTMNRRGLVIEASHDGYLDREGVVHERSLVLSGAGDQLGGVDRVTGADRPWVSRFHLHPAVQLIPTENLRAVILRLPSGEGWRFSADQPIGVEESVALAQSEGPRRTLQMTISLASSAATPQVSWRLERMVRPRRPSGSEVEPELPL